MNDLRVEMDLMAVYDDECFSGRYEKQEMVCLACLTRLSAKSAAARSNRGMTV
ncbi:MAG: hypothetical protein WAU45_24090 [Blastocatellia bacterium]